MYTCVGVGVGAGACVAAEENVGCVALPPLPQLVFTFHFLQDRVLFSAGCTRLAGPQASGIFFFIFASYLATVALDNRHKLLYGFWVLNSASVACVAVTLLDS